MTSHESYLNCALESQRGRNFCWISLEVMYENKQALLMHAVLKSLMFAWNSVSSLDKTRKGSQGSFKGSNNRVLLVLSNKRSLRHEDDNDQARTREDWFG